YMKETTVCHDSTTDAVADLHEDQVVGRAALVVFGERGGVRVVGEAHGETGVVLDPFLQRQGAPSQVVRFDDDAIGVDDPRHGDSDSKDLPLRSLHQRLDRLDRRLHEVLAARTMTRGGEAGLNAPGKV